MAPAIMSFGIWTIGTLGAIDLIAATTNAFNGALVARRPDHYKHFTIIGVVLLALVGGIGGGVLRDVLLNEVPAPLVNPWYLIFATAAALLALAISFSLGQRFRAGLLSFMTAFSLPWYAIVGAQKSLDHHLPYIAALLIGVIATTGGRFVIDIACGLVPKQLVRGEFFVLDAMLTIVLYLVMRGMLAFDVVAATAVAVVFGFGFRLLCQFLGWEEFEPWEPAALEAGEKARHKLGKDLAAEFGGAVEK